jgi:hypothetical protein
MAYGFNLGTSGNWNTDNNFDSSNIDWKGATTALPGDSWESKSSDWGNWDGPKLDSDSGWGKAARFAGDIWKTMQQKKSYRDELESSNRPYGGQTSGSASGQILPNLGVVYPPTFSPIVIPGQQPSGSSGTSGIGSTLGGLAGSALLPGIGGPIGSALGGYAEKSLFG